MPSEDISRVAHSRREANDGARALGKAQPLPIFPPLSLSIKGRCGFAHWR